MCIRDSYDAAFKIIRFNPKATVGSAVLVASVAMLIPILLTAILGVTMDLSWTDAMADPAADPDSPLEPTTGEIAGFVAVIGSIGLGGILQSIGLILVGGMVAHVVHASAVGRRLSLGEAWAATRGQRWKLIGLTFLLGLATMAVMGIYALTWVPIVMMADGWQGPVLYLSLIHI